MNLANKWTQEEIDLAVRNIFKISDEELEQKLGRTMNAIRKKIQTLVKNGKINNYYRPYSKREDDLILEYYGVIPIEQLEMLVMRTKGAIQCRVARLVGESKINTLSGNFTVSDVSPIMGYTKGNIHKLIRKVETPFVKLNNTYVCDYDDFWNWYKDNTQYMNAEAINHEDLYHVPEWFIDVVNEKKRQLRTAPKQGAYNMKEVTLIKHLYKQGKSYDEIAKEVNRKSRSVKELLMRLKKQEIYT